MCANGVSVSDSVFACVCESVEPSWMCVFMGQAVGGGRKVPVFDGA